jgi:hypothetical protein
MIQGLAFGFVAAVSVTPFGSTCVRKAASLALSSALIRQSGEVADFKAELLDQVGRLPINLGQVKEKLAVTAAVNPRVWISTDYSMVSNSRQLSCKHQELVQVDFLTAILTFRFSLFYNTPSSNPISQITPGFSARRIKLTVGTADTYHPVLWIIRAVKFHHVLDDMAGKVFGGELRCAGVEDDHQPVWPQMVARPFHQIQQFVNVPVAGGNLVGREGESPFFALRLWLG